MVFLENAYEKLCMGSTFLSQNVPIFDHIYDEIWSIFYAGSIDNMLLWFLNIYRTKFVSLFFETRERNYNPKKDYKKDIFFST